MVSTGGSLNPCQRSAAYGLVACLLLSAGAHGEGRSIEPGTRFAPPHGRTLLIVGQDADSVDQYVAGCDKCPVPAGITTYLGFYDLLAPAAHFGGLGQDANGAAASDANWGAGFTNAARSAATFQQSALVIGLDISNVRRAGGLAELARGAHDDKIIRLARFCRDLNQPIYLRIGYEFDGTWNTGYQDRATYITAYRRIVDVMTAQRVTNVAFVWQASTSPIDDILENGAHESIRDWYPGSEYVDWVALSWFLTPKAKPAVGKITPPTQLKLANEVLELARAEKKPVMIAEATPQGYHLGDLTRANISPIWDGAAGQNVAKKTADQIWREWYQPLFSYIEANRDVIGALAYINAAWDEQPMWGKPYASGYWGDSRIQANPSIQQRWLAVINGPQWLHGGPSLFATLAHRQSLTQTNTGSTP